MDTNKSESDTERLEQQETHTVIENRNMEIDGVTEHEQSPGRVESENSGIYSSSDKRKEVEVGTEVVDTEHNSDIGDKLNQSGIEQDQRDVEEQDREQMEGEVEVEGEEEDGETRCVCGELDPPDESGLYIQCEKCGVWQHGFCVGIIGGSTNAPDKYWCEQCKPNLHHLYITDLGITRSIYRPAQERRRQNRRRQASQRSSGTITSAVATNTNNNANNNNSSVSNASGGSDTNHYESESPDANNESEIDDDSTASLTTKTDRRKLEDRKRATFKAREEKQYQIMLEKAIKESKMGMPNNSEQNSITDTGTGNTVATTDKPGQETTDDKIQGERPTDNNNINGEGARVQTEGKNEHTDTTATADSASASSSHTKNDAETVPPLDSAAASVEETSSPNTPTARMTRSKRISSSSRRDSSRLSRQSRRRIVSATADASTVAPAATSATAALPPGANGTTQSTQRRKRPRDSSRTRSKSNRVGNTDTEIDVNKPVKPRIPPKNTSLLEMKRRASAILEFISRTQYELSQSQENRDYLVQFIDNDKFLEKVDDMFAQTAKNFELMDSLTRKLILWEQKYVNNELQK